MTKEKAWRPDFAYGKAKSDLLVQERHSWQEYANTALSRAGITEQIDHRTLEAQGLERIPQIHLGAQVAAMEKKGIPTAVGDEYRRIEEANAQLAILQIKLDINRYQTEDEKDLERRRIEKQQEEYQKQQEQRKKKERERLKKQQERLRKEREVASQKEQEEKRKQQEANLKKPESKTAENQQQEKSLLDWYFIFQKAYQTEGESGLRRENQRFLKEQAQARKSQETEPKKEQAKVNQKPKKRKQTFEQYVDELVEKEWPRIMAEIEAESELELQQLKNPQKQKTTQGTKSESNSQPISSANIQETALSAIDNENEEKEKDNVTTTSLEDKTSNNSQFFPRESTKFQVEEVINIAKKALKTHGSGFKENRTFKNNYFQIRQVAKLQTYGWQWQLTIQANDGRNLLEMRGETPKKMKLVRSNLSRQDYEQIYQTGSAINYVERIEQFKKYAQDIIWLKGELESGKALKGWGVFEGNNYRIVSDKESLKVIAKDGRGEIFNHDNDPNNYRAAIEAEVKFTDQDFQLFENYAQQLEQQKREAEQRWIQKQERLKRQTQHQKDDLGEQGDW